MVMIFFNVLLDSVCEYFVEDFCIHAHQRYWLRVLFVVSSSHFGISVILASQNEFGVFPSFSVFWNSLRMGTNSSFKCSVEFASGPGLVFVHNFLINDSISSLVFSLFKFSILVSFLAIYMFLGIYPFLLHCPNCWHIVVHNILL